MLLPGSANSRIEITGRAGFVSLIGRPNAGKSTLLNRLVGEKLSIVSPRPQTTRNRITGIKNLPLAQVVFVDTPGLYPADGKLGDFMLKTAHRAVEDVDVVCLVVDASTGDEPDPIVLDPLRAFTGPVFCVLNKADRVRPKSRMLPLIERWRRSYSFSEIVPVSALEGTNCDRLLELIVGKLPEHPPFFPPDATSDQPETFYVAEMMRGGLAEIDARTRRVTGFIPTGAGDHGLYPSRDARRLYVSNRSGGSVSVLDFRTRRVVATWTIPGGSPDMGGVSADGKVLWLSGRYHSEVYAIDTGTGKLLARIKVGREPHGLCVYPQPGRYSLGHTGILR